MPRLKAFKYDEWARWFLQRVVTDLPSAMAVDTETTGVAWQDTAFCATFTYRDPAGDLVSGYVDLETEERRETAREILKWAPTWIFHNAKFDLEKLDAIGALPAVAGHAVEDTQPLASILNENRRMALKVLAVEELGIEDTIAVEIKSGPNKGKTKTVPREQHHLNAVRRKLKLTKDDGYDLLPREVLIPYALRDTELTLMLWEKLRPQLPEAWEPVYAEEIKVISVLWRMESNGVGLDVPYLQEQAEQYGTEVMRLWQKLVALTGKADFNPNSVPQLHEALSAAGAGKLESTDKAAMRDLLADPTTNAEVRALAETLHDYRESEKIYGTYLTTLLAEQVDGIAHPWINSVGPRTGRFSSSKASN
jgi:DNA polymerase I-like protein with 3'-5' exonuclease and polymerase domains